MMGSKVPATGWTVSHYGEFVVVMATLEAKEDIDNLIRALEANRVLLPDSKSVVAQGEDCKQPGGIPAPARMNDDKQEGAA